MFDLALRLRATGDAGPEQVWQRYADLDRWSEWAPQISAVQTGDGRRLRPGLHGTVRGPLGVPQVTFVVLAVDEVLRRWCWRVQLGPIRLQLDHAIAPIPHGAATTLRLHGPAPIVLGYAPLAQLALHRLVAP